MQKFENTDLDHKLAFYFLQSKRRATSLVSVQTFPSTVSVCVYILRSHTLWVSSSDFAEKIVILYICAYTVWCLSFCVHVHVQITFVCVWCLLQVCQHPNSRMREWGAEALTALIKAGLAYKHEPPLAQNQVVNTALMKPCQFYLK